MMKHIFNSLVAKKRLVISLLAIILVTLITTNYLAGLGKDVINVAVAPKDAKLLLDNKTFIKPGKHKFTSGSHTIKATRAGFKDQIKDFNTQNEPKVVWFKMIPSDETGEKYVSEHQKEFDRISQIENQTTIARLDATTAKYPIIKKLPVSMLPVFIINYGPSKKYPDNPDKIALYISTSSPADKQSAISYIYNIGFDPSDYEIIFSRPPPDDGTGDDTILNERGSEGL